MRRGPQRVPGADLPPARDQANHLIRNTHYMDSQSPIFQLLKRGLYHSTSYKHLEEILRAGVIRPNDGSYPDTFSASKDCVCRQLAAVSLFDFATPPEEDVFDLTVESNWTPWVFRHPLFCFDREKLKANVLSSREAIHRVGPKGAIIYPVEVCHVGEISLSALVGVLHVYTEGVYLWQDAAALADKDWLESVVAWWSDIAKTA
jgi:hypothetical protein